MSQPQKSIITNVHDLKIFDKISTDKRPTPKENKFRFFSTGSSEMLFQGIDVDLDMSYDPIKCKNYLMSELQKKVKTTNMDLIVYLAGGIPFLGGTLADIYPDSAGPHVRRFIYGILTRKVSDKDLNDIRYGPCNISNETDKILLSPLCDSSQQGLCDMACLLGYLNNDGTKSDRLLKSSAALVPFPPLITSLNRLIDRNNVTGRDIITICSTFHTFFSHLIKSVTPPEKIFEYALRCCNMITHIQNLPQKLPILIAELTPGKSDPNSQFLTKLKQPPITYFWTNDSGEEFNFVETEPFDPKAIEDANKGFVSFTPLAPLSVRVIRGCTIIKGKDHTYLYISDSASEDYNKNMVNIYDPLTGKIQPYDLEKFSLDAGNGKSEEVANLIDPEQVQQVIFVCFDASNSMRFPLTGNPDLYPPNPMIPDIPRYVIAMQYLTSFANKTYGYRIPCLLGLISFNEQITTHCQLSPLAPDFEIKGFREINLRLKENDSREVPPEENSGNETHLWDALIKAYDDIIEFTTDSEGHQKFPNAINRLIVISDGSDVKSTHKFLQVAQKLFKKNLIVDSINVSLRGKCKELAVISHLTGGIAFQVDDVFKGLRLFEEGAFLNAKERKPSNNPIIPNDRKTLLTNLKPEMITQEFLQKAVDNVVFDKSCKNIILDKVAGTPKLTTPEFMCFVNKDQQLLNPCKRRILRELRNAAQVMKNDEKNSRYDGDVIVYPIHGSMDVWEVFIKAPDGDPYLGKWFKLVVSFPPLYPVEAPVFRFVTIPYHLNVSSEGRVCMDIIEKNYISSKPVIDIIQEIKLQLLFPNVESAAQVDIDILYNHPEGKEEYESLAKESAEKVGKNSYKEFTKGCHIDSAVDPNFSLEFNKSSPPPYMRSVISGRVFKDPVNIGTKEKRKLYERNELKQLVSSNINPICRYDGTLITLTIKQIDELSTVKIEGIENYINYVDNYDL
ncbi:hypothetical protein M9Y10_037332 [Tritrichomonas musculus]|uniref:UBC core domain-containing protein n=1 Tax=Tritrichomonas musculus TaxID=1915356 RepID=A0ABR2GUE2_9EUKA